MFAFVFCWDKYSLQACCKDLGEMILTEWRFARCDWLVIFACEFILCCCDRGLHSHGKRCSKIFYALSWKVLFCRGGRYGLSEAFGEILLRFGLRSAIDAMLAAQGEIEFLLRAFLVFWEASRHAIWTPRQVQDCVLFKQTWDRCFQESLLFVLVLGDSVCARAGFFSLHASFPCAAFVRASLQCNCRGTCSALAEETE